jgi:hypothetical protein
MRCPPTFPKEKEIVGNAFFGRNVTTVTNYLLALATLDDATKNRNDTISSVALPKLAKASSHMSLLLALSR